MLAQERVHGARREWIWARLGRSPLVVALDALVAAQGAAKSDRDAVHAALDVVYRPWLAKLANRFQHLVAATGYPAAADLATAPGECVLFCDGLRYDLGRHLMAMVGAFGLAGEITWRAAALPTVTLTAKPALLPIVAGLTGGGDLGVRAEQGGGNLSSSGAAKLLEGAGGQVLTADEAGDPAGRAWTELGALDRYGHAEGIKAAGHAVADLREIADRARMLLEAGWRRVRVVTDHGWLLRLGPLPKAAELPVNLAEPSKGRCARLKSGAATELQTLPWRWDPAVRIAYPPGIACFAGNEDRGQGEP